uniref:Uncharacterized protein n=1 Tax=Meloidogyne javanica TaxID=6303 RepID=A0A915M2S7_MELJA
IRPRANPHQWPLFESGAQSGTEASPGGDYDKRPESFDNEMQKVENLILEEENNAIRMEKEQEMEEQAKKIDIVEKPVKEEDLKIGGGNVKGGIEKEAIGKNDGNTTEANRNYGYNF